MPFTPVTCLFCFFFYAASGILHSIPFALAIGLCMLLSLVTVAATLACPARIGQQGTLLNPASRRLSRSSVAFFCVCFAHLLSICRRAICRLPSPVLRRIGLSYRCVSLRQVSLPAFSFNLRVLLTPPWLQLICRPASTPFVLA